MRIEEIISSAEKDNVPIIMEEGLKFILEYINKNNIKSILEVGTAIGFSSINMALQNGNIQVDTLEVDEKRYSEAVKNIKEFNLSDRVHPFLVDAIEFKTDKKYDLIFIDGPKAQYKRHMEHFERNLNDNGVFIFDNLEFHGMVDCPSLTENRHTKRLIKKLKIFRDSMIGSKEYMVTYYKTTGDGIMLCEKVKEGAYDL